MDARKYLIERVVIESSTEEEINNLINNGYKFEGYTYDAEPVYEKYTEVKDY